MQSNTVVREDVSIVLEVMSEFGFGEVLQYRFQRGQHSVSIELLRRSGVIVPERHVRSFPWSNREGHAHDAGLHVVEAIGFSIERNERRDGKFREPRVKCRLRQDLLIVACDGRCLDHCNRSHDLRARRVRRSRDDDANHHSGSSRLRFRAQRLEQRTQFQSSVQFSQP